MLFRELKSVYIKNKAIHKVSCKIGTGTTVMWHNQHITKQSLCSLTIENDSILEGAFIFDKTNSKLSIGDRTFTGSGTKISVFNNVQIGFDVLNSWNYTIVDHNSYLLNFSNSANNVVDFKHKSV
jgi:hypothetical protein